MNAHPRFTEPVDDTPDFTGFMDDYIAQDPTLILCGLTVELREIRISYVGEGECLNVDGPVQITGPGGEIILVDPDADLETLQCDAAALVVAVGAWLDAHRREIDEWAREQMEGE